MIRRWVAISRHWGLFGPFLVIFGIVVIPMSWSRQGKTQEFFDKFKAGLRTHKFGKKSGEFSGVMHGA